MFYSYLIAKKVALFLPRSFCYFIASILADLHFILSTRDRESVLYNLKPLIKNDNLRKSARQVFRNFALYLVDFFRFSKLDLSFLKKYVAIEGEEYLWQAKKRKKGVIALTAHLGNYELGAAFASLLGYKIYAIALPHKDLRVNNFFIQQRKLYDVEVIPTGTRVKKCFQLLRENKIVAFLGDRDFSFKQGVKVKLCGKEAVIPRGPAFFSLKTGACVLPSFLIREPHNKKYYRLIFKQPILPVKENGNKKSEQEIIEEYKKILEKYILKFPTQWYMFQKYWLEEK